MIGNIIQIDIESYTKSGFKILLKEKNRNLLPLSLSHSLSLSLFFLCWKMHFKPDTGYFNQKSNKVIFAYKIYFIRKGKIILKMHHKIWHFLAFLYIMTLNYAALMIKRINERNQNIHKWKSNFALQLYSRTEIHLCLNLIK